MTLSELDILNLAGNEIRVVATSENTGSQHYIFLEIYDTDGNLIVVLRRPAVNQSAVFDISRALWQIYTRRFQYATIETVHSAQDIVLSFYMRAYERIDGGDPDNFVTSSTYSALMGGVSGILFSIWKENTTSFYAQFPSKLRFLTWKPAKYYIPRGYKYEKLYFYTATAQSATLKKDISGTIADLWSGTIEGLQEIELQGNIDDDCTIYFDFSELASEKREYIPIDADFVELIFRNSFGLYDTIHLLVSGYEKEQFGFSEQLDRQKYNPTVRYSREYTMIVENHDRGILRYVSDFLRSEEVYLVYGTLLIPVFVEAKERIMRTDRLNFLQFSLQLAEENFYSDLEQYLDWAESSVILVAPNTILASDTGTDIIYS